MTSSFATIAHQQDKNSRSTIIAWPFPLPGDGVTVVSGPAGSGKTTLLSQWSTDLTALGSPPLRHRANPRLTATQILHGVRESPDGNRTLFLDNADRLGSGVLDEIVGSLEGMESWRLVLAGRGSIGADVDRLGCERLTLLDHRNLTLSDDAVEAVIASHRPELTANQLRVLATEVQGWAFGAQLAGRVMATATRLDEAAADFSGANTLVADYLDVEVFNSLSPRDQEFLVACSVLPELTPESCTLLTGDRFSAERLARLSTLNALVVKTAGTWQWTPMARRFLGTKLDHKRPADVLELRRRARGWSTARHAYDEAIHQGVAAGDWNSVVGIVLDAGPTVTAKGEPARVLGWLTRIPPSILGNEAGLSVVAALALWADAGDDARSAIVDWLAHGKRVAKGRPPGRANSVAAAISVVEAAFSDAGPSRRIELARSAIDDVQHEPSWRAFACWTLGMAAYLDDDTKTARQALADYLNSSAVADTGPDRWLDPRLTAGAIGTLALIELDDGGFDQADILISIVGLQPDQTSPRSKFLGPLELAQARRSLYSQDQGDSLQMLRRLGCDSMLHEIRVLALLDLARAYAERDMTSRYRQSLVDADRLLRAMVSPGRLLARRRNMADLPLGGSDDQDGGGTTLTERELEVLRLLASDMSRRQIAERLFLAHNTVKTYIQRIYRKLGVSSRAAAVARGRERGWTS